MLFFGFRRSAHAIQLFLALAAGLCLAPAASAAVRGTYKLPASVDPEVTAGCVPSVTFGCQTELFAEVVRPNTGNGPFPLLVFLHGNHATCGHLDPVSGAGAFSELI